MVTATSIIDAVEHLPAGEARRALMRELDALLALPEGAIGTWHVAFLDRNLSRIEGTRTDTYKRHPDYAELGQIAENGRLLNALAADAPTSATDAARAGAEMVAW